LQLPRPHASLALTLFSTPLPLRFTDSPRFRRPARTHLFEWCRFLDLSPFSIAFHSFPAQKARGHSGRYGPGPALLFPFCLAPGRYFPCPPRPRHFRISPLRPRPARCLFRWVATLFLLLGMLLRMFHVFLKRDVADLKSSLPSFFPFFCPFCWRTHVTFRGVTAVGRRSGWPPGVPPRPSP